MATEHLLKEDGDDLLQETGDFILLEGRSVFVNGTDYTSQAQLSAFSLTECANRGEVGTGGFDVFDAASALSIPALKAIYFNEPLATSVDPAIFRGFTHERTSVHVTDAARAARSWAVETTDLNVLASDYVLTEAESANRPSETDYARAVWLLTTALNTVGLVGSGVVPNSNTVTMEATDYRGRKPADVLAECSEAAGKLWFIYDYGSGRKLYYDVATGTSLSSTTKISDVAGDPNGSTVFAPVSPVSVKRSPDRVYSKIHLTYNGGVVTATDSAVADAFRRREAHVQDSSINDATLAQAKANKLLAGAAAELLEIDGLEIVVPAANVNDIRGGQRVQIKLARHGISSYTYYRVIRRAVAPLGTTHYHIALGLASDVLAAAQGSRDVWQHKSNANDDGATVIVDEGGITVTDGAITVTNGGATVIIDGTSDMFRISASGTQSVTLAAGVASGSTSVTLSALTYTVAPVALCIHSDSNVSTGGQTTDFLPSSFGTHYVAVSSGGAVTTPVPMITVFVYGEVLLNGSSQPIVRVYAARGNTAGEATRYQKYYVLAQTAF